MPRRNVNANKVLKMKSHVENFVEPSSSKNFSAYFAKLWLEAL